MCHCPRSTCCSGWVFYSLQEPLEEQQQELLIAEFELLQYQAARQWRVRPEHSYAFQFMRTGIQLANDGLSMILWRNDTFKDLIARIIHRQTARASFSLHACTQSRAQSSVFAHITLAFTGSCIPTHGISIAYVCRRCLVLEVGSLQLYLVGLLGSSLHILGVCVSQVRDHTAWTS